MKSFAEIINENYTDSELDRFRHTKLKPKRLKALISDYSEFEHIDLEAWQGYPFPPNSSEQTRKEIQYLISIGQKRQRWQDEMVLYDTKVIEAFKDYLDEYGLEINMERVERIYNHSNPIILSLKRHYGRPRPKVIAEKLGLPLDTFPLKTAETPSYPSGHATQGMLVSLVIADEVPLEHRKNILDIGKRIGESRIIAGAHYQSDTDFGVKLGKHLYEISKKGMEPDLKFESFELKEEDRFISINDTLPKSASDRTEIYEGCAIIEGMGKGINILSHPEFSPICKDWVESFISNVESGQKMILDYSKELGSAMKQLGSFKDFIHKNINDYYKEAPEIFQVQNPDKVNTADAIMISKGTRDDLFRIMREMKGVDKEAQHRRIRTDSKSKVDLLDENDKIVVSFYQVSLKKDAKAGSARIGKVGSFATARFLKDIPPHQPGNLQTLDDEWDKEGDLIAEGISDIFNKGAAVLSRLGAKISKGVDFFYKKIKSVFGKLAKQAMNFAQNFANKEIKKDPISKSANAIVKELESQGALLESSAVRKIEASQSLIKQIKIFNTAMKGDAINKIYQENKKTAKSLNSKFAVKDRPIDPIVILEGGDVKISSNDLKKLRELDKLKEGDEITLGLGTPVDTVFKLTSNWAGMNYIKGILNYVEKKIPNYENLSSSLFALAAEFEGEARFGNTALPLVIVYGGNKLKHMGKRDDFEKKKVEDLSKVGKEYNNFPVLVIRINKVAGKSYNSVNILLVESLSGTPPEPEYMSIGISTNSGSKFATKFEVNTTTKNWRGAR
tara:strand:- start:327 stop:2690 length:2364 start_codon:yes stop_codon:yes gene_type:complete